MVNRRCGIVALVRVLTGRDESHRRMAGAFASMPCSVEPDVVAVGSRSRRRAVENARVLPIWVGASPCIVNATAMSV